MEGNRRKAVLSIQHVSVRMGTWYLGHLWVWIQCRRICLHQVFFSIFTAQNRKRAFSTIILEIWQLALLSPFNVKWNLALDFLPVCNECFLQVSSSKVTWLWVNILRPTVCLEAYYMVLNFHPTLLHRLASAELGHQASILIFIESVCKAIIYTYTYL